jgi:hypothetical protein
MRKDGRRGNSDERDFNFLRKSRINIISLATETLQCSPMTSQEARK